MQLFTIVLTTIVLIGSSVESSAASKTRDIYFIDVEGGQSTLLVTPARESLLIDTGWAGDGKAGSKPGKPADAPDANRILAAAMDADIKRIDYLLITHFHADHNGSVSELSELIPIGTFIDHGSVGSAAELNVPGTLDAFNSYKAIRDRHQHLQPATGGTLPLKGIEATVVSSALSTIIRPFGSAGQTNAACGVEPQAANDPNENASSTGVVVKSGKFRFLDIGDLTVQPLYRLVCPDNMIGAVDVYLLLTMAVPMQPRRQRLPHSNRGCPSRTMAPRRAVRCPPLHCFSRCMDQAMSGNCIAQSPQQTKTSPRNRSPIWMKTPRTGSGSAPAKMARFVC